MERELAEMFNVQILESLDTRNLLLDYHYTNNPLLKHFNVEGFQEVYLNLFTDKLNYVETTYIEL